MRLTDFEVLTFDCYGTLIDWESGILAALAPWRKRAGIALGNEVLLTLFSEVESKIEAERPTLLYSDLLAATLVEMGERSGARPTESEARAFGQSVKDWPAFPDSAEALAYLHRHYKLAILSNVDRASFAHSARRLGQEFDLVVTAEDVGSYKPALKHFEVALATLAAMGIPKGKVLHTAQSLFHDHVPAKQMGLTSFWIDRRAGRTGTGATKPPPVPVKPDGTAPSLAAMVEMHRREADR
ncbi:haloacid dehalogenase [Hypericibacter adhaerens]|uniref:Haloacid dehalogenase n=1 Tax=Hypericibacter adhaerens TaxID=2602016 RepID=A0A5J6N6Y2_9PROT|nr:haloacid dehalogenase type II [Hypericibacter adhaerens]QEX24523.1 haloacid dehalogenase [Hypericibacter adhaerens]